MGARLPDTSLNCGACVKWQVGCTLAMYFTQLLAESSLLRTVMLLFIVVRALLLLLVVVVNLLFSSCLLTLVLFLIFPCLFSLLICGIVVCGGDSGIIADMFFVVHVALLFL